MKLDSDPREQEEQGDTSTSTSASVRRSSRRKAQGSRARATTRSRAQLGARGLSSALAGWRAFDGPSSAAGLSDRRICAGGLAGFLTGWPDLPLFASGSTDRPMWRTIDRAIADGSRDFGSFCATPTAPPGSAAGRRGRCQRARLSGFQPVLLRQKNRTGNGRLSGRPAYAPI